MNDCFSLSEYRMMHPHSDSIPTVTQSGVLGQVLDRQRQRAARQLTLRTYQGRLADAFAWWVREWRALPASAVRGFGEALHVFNAAQIVLKLVRPSQLTNAHSYPGGLVTTT